MSELLRYPLRAESRDALLDMLTAAQEGKERPFVIDGEEGERRVDESRIRRPYEEFLEDEPTGYWLCEVWLTEPDSDLAAIAEAP